MSLSLDFSVPQPETAARPNAQPIVPQDLRTRLLAAPGLSEADRAQLNDLFDRQQRYGLVWEDKPEDVEQDLATHLPVLEEVPERALVASGSPLSAGEGGRGGEVPAPQHTLIEGDNLHALTVLNYTHAGLVDVIYIDPPYNTGNRDFIYNDRFVDREDSYRHSKWLSFMAKRLKLARKLLKETGVIFISIDDNEQAQLKLLCDEIFGEENFVGNIIWQSRTSISNDDHISTNHNHTFIFARDKSQMTFQGEALDASEYINPDNDVRGAWKLVPIDANKAGGDTVYPILNPNNNVEYYPPGKRIWAINKASYEKLFADGRIKFGLNNDSSPKRKLYLNERLEKGDTKTPSSILLDAGTTKSGTSEIIDIFHEKLFSYPKPTTLIKRLVGYATGTNKSALILDFFAGSGTTLHATMALNAEDGGTRRCILVTNNENNICEQVTYERNRRVIQGYTTPKGVAVPGLLHNSLRYYRTALAESGRGVAQKRQLVQRATALLCFKDGCHFLAPAAPGHAALRLFQNHAAAPTCYLLMVYDEAAIGHAVALLDSLLPAAGTTPSARAFVYVFADGHDPYTEDFEPVADRGVALCAVPEALLQAFRKARTTSRAGRALPGQ